MAPAKRKPAAKQPAAKQASPDAAVVPAQHEEEGEGDLARRVQSLPPPASDEAIALASIVRARQGVRDVRFEPIRGVVLMFGYGGLMRVHNGIHHVHIATLEDLALMDDQQLYDAVMVAGGKR